jgi:hypothetical protein
MTKAVHNTATVRAGSLARSVQSMACTWQGAIRDCPVRLRPKYRVQTSG